MWKSVFVKVVWLDCLGRGLSVDFKCFTGEIYLYVVIYTIIWISFVDNHNNRVL